MSSSCAFAPEAAAAEEDVAPIALCSLLLSERLRRRLLGVVDLPRGTRGRSSSSEERDTSKFAPEAAGSSTPAGVAAGAAAGGFGGGGGPPGGIGD